MIQRADLNRVVAEDVRTVGGRVDEHAGVAMQAQVKALDKEITRQKAYKLLTLCSPFSANQI